MTNVRQRALRAFRNALRATGADPDAKGYVPHFVDNLLPSVATSDFEADLEQGSGAELYGKFRAAHSSSALAVNCFGPFKRYPSDLQMLGARGFERLSFEKKCPTGLHGTPPHLDVFLEGAHRTVAIESKCVEYLSHHPAHFASSYKTFRDSRRDSPWFREMLRLMDDPGIYRWLDAAQLIKHAYGLMRNHPNATLLYLYWEPLNAHLAPFEEHRREIEAFADKVGKGLIPFRAMSYNALWGAWDRNAPAWLGAHLEDIRARYAVEI